MSSHPSAHPFENSPQNAGPVSAFGQEVSLPLAQGISATADEVAEAAAEFETPVALHEFSTPSVTTEGELPQASYPSAVPAPVPARKPRSQFAQWMRGDQTPTAPIRGLARVAQKQFSVRAQIRREGFVQEKEQARDVLNFTVRLAETMFHYGADAMDVDAAIVGVCAAYGLENVEANVTNQSIILNYVSDVDRGSYSPFTQTTDDLRFSHTAVRVMRSMSENYAALSQVYKLIHSITEQGLPREKAQKRLQEINDTPKLNSPFKGLLFNLLMAASFTFGVGGSWRGALVAVFVFLVLHTTGQWAAKFGLPGFFRMIINASVMTGLALYISDYSSFFGDIGFVVSAPHVIGGGLMMFMPTFFLVSSVQDAINGFPLTSAGKMVSTAMTFLGLIIGIATATEVMGYLGATEIDVQAVVFNPPPLWMSIAGMIIGSVMCASVVHGTLANMGWVVVISGLGQAVYYGYSTFTGAEMSRVNTVLAALTVGAVSAYLANRLHSPRAIFAVPGIMFLLPGLTFFKGFYAFSVSSDPTAGVAGIVSALSTIVALAGGVVLGGYLMQYLIQWRAARDSARAVRLATFDR
ncbi:threonine/serine exporter family protein [Rothia terrae]|uniref:Threonine/serine exporter family protein n=1 Tax=Rothia terrae TaxID=396015 RepID=A0A7H2BEJ7_9MICC|nr:threonine/serine exporter family protein [Rothia terrae]QNV38093.1 threonine/serine exporter family protein [Rothia terrae]